MFELIGKALYQWDLDRQIEVTDDSVSEVHFAHPGDEKALVVEVDEADGVRVASIPNILLQGYAPIKVWLVVGDVTVYGNKLTVTGRAKPDDYVYTETEVKRYETLEKRIEALEQNGGGSVDLTEIEADITELQEDVGKLSEEISDLKENAPTDEHINELISNALGVVENGYY